MKDKKLFTKASLVDLTREDPEPQLPCKLFSTQNIYDISDESTVSPAKTGSSDDFWSNNSISNSESFYPVSPTQDKLRFTYPIPFSDSFYVPNFGSGNLSDTYDQQGLVEREAQVRRSSQANAAIIDLTMDD